MKQALPVVALAAMLVSSRAPAQEVSADLVTVAVTPPAPAGAPGNKAVRIATVIGVVPLPTLDTDQASALIGHGYDPITGRVMNMQCVVANGPQFQMEKGATIPYKNKNTVTDQKSYAKVSSSSFGISAVFKAVSLGVGTSHASGSAMNSVDSYGRLFNRIATKGGEYYLVQWAPATGGAPAPLRLLKTDLPEFIRQCGTYFIKGVYSGQQLDTLTSFVLRQTETSASNATSVSVSVAKIFGASASFASAASDANQFSDASIENNGKGALGVAVIAASGPGQASPPPGGGTPPAPAPAPTPPTAGGAGASAGASATVPTDASGIQAMLDYYENGFAKAVAALTPDQLVQTALPLYILIDHYQGNLLPSASKVPVWADDVYAEVDSKIDTYNALVGVIADLESVLAVGPHPRIGVFYVDPTQKDAKDPSKNIPGTTPSDHLKAAKLMLKNFQTAVTNCQKLVAAPGTNGQTASKTCQAYLDANLNDDDVTALALTRKYS